RVGPGQVARAGEAPGAQLEERPGEVEPEHLGGLLRPPPGMLGARPESDTPTGCGATRTAGALVGGGAAHRLNAERVDAVPRIKARDAGEPCVDDRRHALDRERGLRDVRREHHPSPRTDAERALL